MHKIKSFQLYSVPPRWLFLKLETEDGLTGWGEPIVEGRARTVACAVKELMEKYVINRDFNEIEDIWNVLYRGGFYRGGSILMSALSGIDQALWDLKGKSLGVPVYELLGGSCRSKVRVYRWIGGDQPNKVTDEAKKCLNKGFTAVKMNISGKLKFIESAKHVAEIIERVQLLRETIGNENDIAIDFHGRVSPTFAPILIKKLEAFSPLFIEEPVLPGYTGSLRLVKNKTFSPIALGERLYSRWDFKPYLENNLVDVVQPDVSHAGGITECKKIASYAEIYGAHVAIHCPLGPIALAASLQLAFSIYNYLIQETSIGIHYNEGIELIDYVVNKEIFEVKNGYVEIFKQPGLGIKMNEDVVKEAAKSNADWSNPIWRYEDGSFAEW